MGLFENDWVIGVLDSSVDWYIDEFIVECTVRKWSLPTKQLKEVCHWGCAFLVCIFLSGYHLFTASSLLRDKQLSSIRSCHHDVSALELAYNGLNHLNHETE